MYLVLVLHRALVANSSRSVLLSPRMADCYRTVRRTSDSSFDSFWAGFCEQLCRVQITPTVRQTSLHLNPTSNPLQRRMAAICLRVSSPSTSYLFLSSLSGFFSHSSACRSVGQLVKPLSALSHFCTTMPSSLLRPPERVLRMTIYFLYGTVFVLNNITSDYNLSPNI
jgi:hypothetical protein